MTEREEEILGEVNRIMHIRSLHYHLCTFLRKIEHSLLNILLLCREERCKTPKEKDTK
jgi:hypothetical protein